MILRHRKGNELNEVLTNFLLTCEVEGKSPFTVSFYAYRLKPFISFLSQQGIKNLRVRTPNYVRLFLLNLQRRGLAPSTIQGYYAALNVFFNWLQREKIIKQSPLENIKRPRMPKKNIRAFSGQEIQRILSTVSGDKFMQVRNRAMVLLLLDTGIRLGELTKIQLGDIGFSREIIRIMGKGNKERIVRMGRLTQEAVWEYITEYCLNRQHIWTTKGGVPLKREGVQTAVRGVCYKAGINGAKPGPHTFRHTFAISYLRNGGDLITLQNLLGHSNLEMTKRYLSSLNEEDLTKAHRKFSPVDNLLK